MCTGDSNVKYKTMKLAFVHLFIYFWSLLCDPCGGGGVGGRTALRNRKKIIWKMIIIHMYNCIHMCNPSVKGHKTVLLFQPIVLGAPRTTPIGAYGSKRLHPVYFSETMIPQIEPSLDTRTQTTALSSRSSISTCRGQNSELYCMQNSTCIT